MPLPRTLFSREAPVDHELTVSERHLARRPHR